VPRDRIGEFEPQLLKKYSSNTNELEDKVIAMYAEGMSVRDIQESLDTSPGTPPVPPCQATMVSWPASSTAELFAATKYYIFSGQLIAMRQCRVKEACLDSVCLM